MIKLKWSQINKKEFVEAIVTLSRTAKLNEKTAYRAGRLFEAAKRSMEMARDKEREIIVKGNYQIKNAEGVPLFEDDGFPMVDPNNQQKFINEFQALLETTEIEIKIEPLDFTTLTPAGLTPAQLIALEPVISGLPEGEPGDFALVGAA